MSKRIAIGGRQVHARQRAIAQAIESLESRVLLSATSKVATDVTADALSKVGTALSSASREFASFTAAGNDADDFVSRDGLLRTRGELVAINAYTLGDAKALEAHVRALDADNVQRFSNGVSAWVPLDRMTDLAAVPELTFARPVRVKTNVGVVTSQGDAAQRADLVRSAYGYTGVGAKVGILSDSFDTGPGSYALDVASNDLPAGVQVLEDYAGGSDEGRGMAQLVYDTAPGSTLAFATAFNSKEGFANNIKALRDNGSDVIVDDVIWFDEPMFQDGVIAQAVDDVVSTGVSYFSSAGNSARASYQSAYSTGVVRGAGSIPNTTGPAFAGGTTHDFDPGAGVDEMQAFSLANGQDILLTFQWADAYGSVPGSASCASDMDIYVLNAAGTQIVGGATDVNNGAGLDPVEIFQFVNTSGSAQTYQLMIVLRNGSAPPMMKYVNFGTQNFTEWNTNSGTLFGHANATGAAGVAAAPYYLTPAFGITPPQLESFSSPGGTPIYFSPTGVPLGSSVIRQQPRFTAPDGGNTSFFYADSGIDADAFPNFFGTSAAAPAAAAVAALMLQVNPALTPTQIYTALANSTIDMDDPSTGGFDVGYDFASGTGLIRADVAIAAVGGVQLSNISGRTFHDFNANSTLNGGETTLNGVTVYLDANNNGSRDTGSSSPASTDIPKAIPDFSATVSTLNIAGINGVITDLNVTLGITHTWDADLDVFLISPSGVTVELFTDVGGNGDNVNTTLDDEAINSITVGAPPFTGSFKPEGLLSALDGTDPNGLWRLYVADDESFDTGTLNSWSLNFTYAERAVVSAGAGNFAFNSMPTGNYVFREIAPAGYVSINSQTVNVTGPGLSFPTTDLANVATVYTGSGASDDYLIRRNVANTAYEILISGTPVYIVPISAVSTLTFNLGVGNDSLTADYVNGTPIPASGIVYDGQTNIVGGDTLAILGTSAAQTAVFNAGSVSLSGTITFSNTENVKFDGKLGLDVVTVNSGANVTFPATQRFASLTMNNGSTATLAQDGARVIHTDAISLTGSAKLDLADNDLLVNYSGLSPLGSFNGSVYTGLTGQVATGRNGGFWNAAGITTTQSDATSGSNYTTLGIAEASDVYGLGPTDTMLYEGQTIDATTVVIKYTYGGDANLSGNVDIDDYGLIDFNASTGGVLTGFFNGDFDFNGVQDIDDYGIIDFVVNIQGPPL